MTAHDGARAPTPTGRVRLLIVDDHPVVRDGLRAMLTTQPDFDVAGEADSGAAALAFLARDQPDVVLMDLQMPELDGVAAIRRIAAAHPGVRMIVLTTYETDGDITKAIDAGAIGYLLKDTGRDALFAAIRDAAAGRSSFSPTVATRVADHLRAGSSHALSTREIEVLNGLAHGDSNRQVARALHISEATVKTHLLHIYAKLGVADRTSAVVVAVGRGIIRLG
jgi:DNA-binding NarL/FixJ family response regulator